MDYSVGSLSDLITGSNTPNKRKVIKKQIVSVKENKINDELSPFDKPAWTESNAEVVVSPKKKKIKSNKNPSTENKKPKKRALLNYAEGEPPKKKKKSRNADAEPPINEKESPVNPEDEPPKKKKKSLTNAERRIHDKEKIKKELEDPELSARTAFVGNLPITINLKIFKKLFSKFGKIDAVRIRGVPVADLNTPKKVAIIKKEFHPERKSFYGFARFVNRDDAIKATEANGMIYQDHHLRIHLCDKLEEHDENRAIFIGNLSFYAEEDDLWKLFEPCGPIDSVRVVRDNRTGIGKGFGYVNFKNSDSVSLALELENVKLKDRELRISISNVGAAKKNKKKNKLKKITKPGRPRRRRNNSQVKPDKENKVVENDAKENKVVKNEGFQGVKFMEKQKKNKSNKGLLKKKKLIKQVAPK